eukprot:CAMPEP_0113322930 /NCGR_PEP_ID=MMETSP0010_2-20120614/15942_1 /TAXON_ID=216773 ORGANISM="Corethron hystrix, Strain 308" /NCGR_SAMPLE_ID=MMETSP0010_2 /ASSEMBLY_ACC=CAM_ASM_000155 /LENGTH=111 /DNA_ID=CAMNT_0000181611 /DNA_START=11 /DNA_END=346 /DNA_ORIENTATION=- /assembly_acc=CAM_ASM_000155
MTPKNTPVDDGGVVSLLPFPLERTPHHKSSSGGARVSTSLDRPISRTWRNATKLPELAQRLDSTVSVLVGHLTDNKEGNDPPPDVWKALAEIQEVATVLDTAGRSEEDGNR